MPTTRAYRSKIGRLPFALRNELNERIRDGAKGADLLAWLNATPEYRRVMRADSCGAVNAQNLTEWRGTGYKDWMDDQAQADRIRKAADVASTITLASGCDPSTVAARIAAASLIEMVTNPDDPKALSDAARAIASLRNTEIGAEKNKIAKQKQSLDSERLALERDKFRRQTCEIFLKWARDNRALEIVDSKKSNDEKIKALLKYMDAEEATA